MLTPIFNLKQTDHLLFVHLHAPMAKISELEVCIVENLFYFTASPYYLKFEIPGSVFADEDHIKVDLDGGEITVTLNKTEPAIFPDLDMITKLLSPRIKTNATQALVEEIGEILEHSSTEPDLPIDWFATNSFSCLEHEVDDDDNDIPPEIIIHAPTYGFAGSKSDLFRTESDLSYAVDLPNPDSVSQERRGRLRMLDEQQKFSADHYLADLFQKDDWLHLANFTPPWKQPSSETIWSEQTSEERHRLIVLTSRRLPIIPKDMTTAIYLGLVDILLAYVYDFRVREGEEMTESGWNLVKLASTLSWFQVFHSLPELLSTFYRRSLVYPLVRSWCFSRLVHLDVAELLQTPDVKAGCLKCLLEIRSLLVSYPGCHVFADLYLDDYIVWIQTRASATELRNLGLQLEKYKLKKSDVHLNLPTIEKVGIDCVEAEQLQVATQRLSLQCSVASSQ